MTGDYNCPLRFSGGNLVLALQETARIVLRCDMKEPHISRQRAEERNAFSNKHRHTGDDETLNQPSPQEPLYRNSSIDVEVMSPAPREFRNDLSRIAGHLFHNRAARRR